MKKRIVEDSQDDEQLLKYSNVLNKLGFNGDVVIKSNLFLVKYDEKYVLRRFHIINLWFSHMDYECDVHSMFVANTELWSVKSQKLFIVLLITIELVGISSTPKQICNMLNMPTIDILIAYLEGHIINLDTLCENAKKMQKSTVIQLKKEEFIVENQAKLPERVYEYFQQYYMNAA